MALTPADRCPSPDQRLSPWVGLVSWRGRGQLRKHVSFITSDHPAKVNHEVMPASLCHPAVIKTAAWLLCSPQPQLAYRCVVIKQLV